MPFPGAPDRYPGRDEVAGYLERYASWLGAEIQTSTRVQTIRQDGRHFIVVTKDGRRCARPASWPRADRSPTPTVRASRARRLSPASLLPARAPTPGQIVGFALEATSMGLFFTTAAHVARRCDPRAVRPCARTAQRPVLRVKERGHGLAEVAQGLLLHRLGACGPPRVPGPRLGELPALLPGSPERSAGPGASERCSTARLHLYRACAQRSRSTASWTGVRSSRYRRGGPVRPRQERREVHPRADRGHPAPLRPGKHDLEPAGLASVAADAEQGGAGRPPVASRAASSPPRQ